ncbi:MAG: phosphomannomutase/phosphoglucomutase [Mariprofundaceae bacterium]|nr:phosphomannomutase/phosphoglucomutase [Mariprofundaceae bacterium]
MMKWPKHIFRAYGIRGDVGSEVDEALAWHLGWHVAQLLLEPEKGLVVAWDVRLSSQSLANAVMRGAREAGISVCCLGVAPTPLAYFWVHHQDKAGCIMVTGSHNPAHQNGFKIMVGKQPITQELYQQLCQQIHRVPTPKISLIAHVHQQVAHYYLQYIAHKISLKRRLRVVVDAGNGPGGMLAVPLYRLLGCQVEPLFCELDGHFPNHHPDPSNPENLIALKKKVKDMGADLGIAFDGDADRLAVVDALGEEFSADHLMVLFAKEVLRAHPHGCIVSEVRSSQGLIDDVAAQQGRLVISACGHAKIQQKMHAESALLGGEMNGHFFFSDHYYGFDDGVYAGARLLELLSQQPHALNELRPIESSILLPEIRIPCADDKKFQWVAQAKLWFSHRYDRICLVDGVRINFDGGWCLLRASNTQAMLSVRMEAGDSECFVLIYNALMTFLASQSEIDRGDFQKEIMSCVSTKLGMLLA